MKKRLSDSIKALVKNNPQEVEEVLLFGSASEDSQTVSSDIDIVIILTKCNERFIDRSLRFREYFETIGVGVDIFVYTKEEAAEKNIPLLETALKRGKSLFKRS